MLSPTAAAELERRYNEEAYPEVYPDPAFALPFYTSAERLPELDQNQQVAIRSLRDAYVREHAEMSRKLAEAIYNKRAVDYRHDIRDYYKKAAEAEEEVKRLALKREQLDLAQPARVRVMLAPEQNERLSKWIFEVKKPPRPWAQVARLPQDEPDRERNDHARKGVPDNAKQ